MKYLTFESEGNNPICVIKESKDKARLLKIMTTMKSPKTYFLNKYIKLRKLCIKSI